ncbi:efflux transporter outer membrane subunit [Sinomicrobium soli]|uniref:efflux transporter outer membrane subunit n=1 Tax=Sinomicrobium sp. N-1-3-6 TaxID=2219864 RepID=UPI000DCAF10D|nr:efflux transporter outer membrane subunit [Sinomicrobium sp. N-1-3-6]RAV30943.1 TolC family protein [Sinomicrobium sp. N-1-3-6]
MKTMMMNKMNSLLYKGALTVLISVSVIGCKVGENYKRPELDQPSAFSRDSVEADSISVAKMEWREFFKDSMLISLIDTALQNNFEMSRAALYIAINDESLRQSKANFLPSLESSPAEYVKEYFSENYYSSPASSYYGDRTPPSSFYIQQQEYISSLSSSWELDIWGKFRRQKESALAGYMESVELKKAVQTSLIAEVASTYYNLLMLNAQLEVANSNLALNDSTLTILRLQYEAGEVTSLAVQQTESQRLKAEGLIPQLEKEYTFQENKLNVLLGRYPRHIEIERELEEVDSETIYDTGVPVDLIANRPDVAASEYALIAANANVGVAESLKYPSLTLNADLGLNTLWLKNLFDPVGSGFAVLNGAIFQPIFQNRKIKTNFRIAQKEREIAIIDFKERFTEAVSEVSNALVSIDKLNVEYEVAKKRITVAQSSVNNAELLFRSGLANYLEVLTAQSNALESDLNLVSVKMQMLLANIELYRSLGGGWQ